MIFVPFRPSMSFDILLRRSRVGFFPASATRRARRWTVSLALAVVCSLATSGGAHAAHVVTWGRIGTVTTLTQGQLCTNDGWNISCDSTTPTIASGLVGIGSTAPVVSLDLSQETDALALPVGTSGMRPTGANLANGELRYNSTLSGLETYVNGTWDTVLTAASLGSSLPAAGSNGQVQFNNGGVLGASANLTWNNSSGSLGIGTTSPTYALDVTGAIRANGGSGAANAYITTTGSNTGSFLNISNGNNNISLGMPNASGVLRYGGSTNAVLSFDGNGVEINPTNGSSAPGTGVGFIVASGNVGIGSPTPFGSGATLLSVSGSGAAAASNYGSIALQNPATSTQYTWGAVDFYGGTTRGASITGASVTGGTGYGVLNFLVNNNGTLVNEATVASTGLQIGNNAASVSGNLDVYNSNPGALTNGVTLGNMRTSAASNIGISFVDYNSNTIASIQDVYPGGTSTGSLAFYTNNGGTNTEQMRITNTGSVGIGTASPGAQLEVTIGTAATKGLIVQQAASQTADMQEWQTSIGTTLMSIDSNATLQVSRGVGSATRYDGTIINVTCGNGMGCIEGASNAVGVYGLSGSGTPYTTGPFHWTTNGAGVLGVSAGGTGVEGDTTSAVAVGGHSHNGTGVYGYDDNIGVGGQFSSVAGYGLIVSSGNVGIGTTSPNTNAMLQLYSTTKGFLPPLLATTNETSMGTSLPTGLVVYNTTNNELESFNGTNWEAVGANAADAAGSTGQVQFNNGGDLAASANFFWDNTHGRVGIGTTSPSYSLTSTASIGILDSPNTSSTTATVDAIVFANSALPTTYTNSISSAISGGASTLAFNIANSSSTRVQGLTLTSDAGVIEVGINNSSPSYGLDFLFPNLSQFRLGWDASHYTVLATNSSGNLSIAPTNNITTITGNVGIGTTSPGSSLQVNGGAAVGYSTSTAAPTNGLTVSGNVGVGTASVPTGVTESINGPVKVAGTGSEPCTAAQVGSMRYNPTGAYMEICTYP